MGDPHSRCYRRFARTRSHIKFAWHHLIHIAPDPFLAWLDRSHERMTDVLKMLGGMSIFR
jgi:hypothetical protein